MKRTLIAVAALVAAACGPKNPPAPATTPTPAPAPTPGASTAKDFAQVQPVEGSPLETDRKPEEITAACAAAEKSADERLAKVVAVPDAQRTFAGTFEALEDITVDYSETVSRLTFLKDIHTDEKVREAAAACEVSAGKYGVALGARKDLYLASKGYLENAGKKDALDAQQKRLVEITMRDFRRNGLELADAQREELVKIRQRLTELATKFSTNLGEDKTTITVKKADLKGLPEDWIKDHKPGKNGLITLTTKYPDYTPVMESCKVEATRKKMEIAFMNRGGAENVKMLNEAIELRAKAAKLLGYATHLDYVTDDRMAKDGKTVNAFLDRMREGLRPGLEADTAKMQKLKAADTKNAKATIQAWDWRHYMSEIKKKDYAIDDEEVRQFFPQQKVIGGMFEVYSRLFGVTFKEVEGAKVWADGVHLYEVRDNPSNRLLAKFYIDFYPREGKYGHAAEFSLTQGHVTPAGYKIPWACLVLNFAPPKGTEPAFLSLNEVGTLFHEFGHVMHESLTTARYASQAGTSTARDFVEAPSQMLENWVYQPEVLAMISQDPKDPKKVMPAELAKKVVAARKYNAGVHYSRQLFLGTFDATIHASDKADSDKVAKELWAKIVGFPEDPNAHFAGTFGHMFGYDGGYYGYLWSEVFQADMFTKFQKNGVLDPKTGRAYRDIILAKGRTVEAQELLKEFLGRDPSEDAFLELVGIKKSS
jgi:thimet oligopeptidase